MRNSPLSASEQAPYTVSSSASFRLLERPVQQWIWRNRWDALRDIQERSIPLLIKGDRDLVIAAPTSSGKTEAAFVPLLSRMVASKGPAKGFALVYVSPLKALINDQFRRLDELCEALDVPVHRWHGDVAGSAKSRAIRDPRGVLLITPESLEAMFVRRGGSVPTLFRGTQSIVVDELHAMLDTERGMQLRSLLHRLEVAVGRRVRRVGLSATLGDMELAKAYLRPGGAHHVDLVRSKSEGQDVKIQLKGYVVGDVPDDAAADEEIDPRLASERSIAAHIFRNLRGRQNLVFVDSRQQVESLTDHLTQLSEREHLPNEFYAHHANLARQHREFVEDRLRRATQPTTAVCTSTLELGIDIPHVQTIAQVGPPFSVSSTRQRLGRSGRRVGDPAVIRTYVQETVLQPHSHPIDALRLRVARSIAVFELLLDGWCEPPAGQALHLSTLVQQILSVIAERGGAKAAQVYDTLCRMGPFATVSTKLFVALLRSIGEGDRPLIEQAPDGTLLLAARGESLVEHYTFHAVFGTPEEYRVMAEGRLLGSLPVSFAVVIGSTIILSGKRWRVTAVDTSAKVLDVKADSEGTPPKFSGSPGMVHDRVAERMRDVYRSREVPAYLDPGGRRLLEEGRRVHSHLGLLGNPILQIGVRQSVIFPWQGTNSTETLALVLMSKGLRAAPREHVVVEVEGNETTVRAALRDIAAGEVADAPSLAALMRNLEREKYHPFISAHLQCLDAASATINVDRVPELARQLLRIASRSSRR